MIDARVLLHHGMKAEWPPASPPAVVDRGKCVVGDFVRGFRHLVIPEFRGPAMYHRARIRPVSCALTGQGVLDRCARASAMLLLRMNSGIESFRPVARPTSFLNLRIACWSGDGYGDFDGGKRTGHAERRRRTLRFSRRPPNWEVGAPNVTGYSDEVRLSWVLVSLIAPMMAGCIGVADADVCNAGGYLETLPERMNGGGCGW